MPPTPNNEALAAARAHIKWLAFGECRADGWNGPPPTAAEAIALIDKALASSGQAASAVPEVEPIAEFVGYHRLGFGMVPTIMWAEGKEAPPVGTKFYPRPTQPASAPAREGVRCADCDIENGCPEYCRCTPPAPRAASIDIEAMIRACVPGGNICDPQQVADALRSYAFTNAPRAPSIEPTDEQIIARCEAAGMKWLPPFEDPHNDGDFRGAFDLSDIESLRKLLAAPASAGVEEFPLPTVDEIAQQIRWLDGSHKMGAGVLAEKLHEWLRSYSASLGKSSHD